MLPENSHNTTTLTLHYLINPFGKKFKLQILPVHPVIPAIDTSEGRSAHLYPWSMFPLISPSPEPQLWYSEPLCGQFLTGLKSGSGVQKRDKWDCCFYHKRAAVVVIVAAWLHSWFPLHSSRQLLIRHFWCNLGFLTFLAFMNFYEGDWIHVPPFMNGDMTLSPCIELVWT